MPDFTFLKDLVVVLGAAVAVVSILRRLGIPTIAGFILGGAMSGPSALGLVHDTHEVEMLAEIGVVLLLFGIGLELSIDRIKRLWKAVLLGGSLQVAITGLVAAGIGYFSGLPVGSSIFLGCIFAVSSTALVLRSLSAKGEIESPQGRLAVGILVFQDLCVVPMILAVPFLGGGGGSAGDALTAGLRAVGVLVGVVVIARVIVPTLLALIGRTRERDLFVLTVFLVCFGTAWALSTVGISLALGAFLAGLVVAGSEFRHQALTDLIPIREVLASIFFVSVGMLLDVGAVAANLGPILALLAAIVVGKAVIILLVATILRTPLPVGVLTATALCQVGEFAFVLLNAAAGSALLPPALAQNLLVAVIMSMLVTPLMIAVGPSLAKLMPSISWLAERFDTGDQEEHPASGHVVVAGYGLAGQDVCRQLDEHGFPFVAADVNTENLRIARDHQHPAIFADVTQQEVLAELGIQDAKLFVIAINYVEPAARALRAARRAAPHVPVLVRTQYSGDVAALLEAGADEIISAEDEAALALVGLIGRGLRGEDPGAVGTALQPDEAPPKAA